MVLVSVVMPSYNHAAYIPDAIESVLRQNPRDIELIIIDDYSKDKSRDIIQSYQNRDSRIRTIFHEKNLGMSRSYNDGLNAAEGKYVAFLDSDDVWRDNKLETQLRILRRNEDLVVWSEGRIVDRRGKSTGQTFSQIYDASRKRKSGDLFDILLFDNFIFGSSLIVKRNNIGGTRFDCDLKYLNDYRFVVDLARNFQYCFINEQLVDYRIHGKNTILNQDWQGWLREAIRVREYFISKYNIRSRVKADMFFRISSAYSRLGQKQLARQFLLKGLSQKPPGIANLLYVVKQTSFVGSFLLKIYYSLYFFATK